LPIIVRDELFSQANEILSSFDVSLRQYATNHLSKVINLSFRIH
jgi:hypothetical protein